MSGPFRGRSDSEHEQAFVRVGVGLLAGAYLFVTAHLSGETSAGQTYSLWVAGVFLVTALAWLLWIAARPQTSPTRRTLGIFTDLGACCVAMYLTGAEGAPFYVILLWVIFGNGFRFGRTYLAIATFLGTLGFGLVVTLTPFWAANPRLTAGLFIGLIILPLYVASLLRRLTRAVETAREASEAKSQFLANMSHEVRTPLNAVLVSADLLETTPLNPTQIDLVRTVRASAGNLLSLVENVLDVSKLEAGKFIAHDIDFDLYLLLQDIIQVFTPQSQSRGILLRLNVSPSMPFRVKGDPTLIRQVLTNLVSNAIKFTDSGSVEVTVEVEAQDERRVVALVKVSDTGSGIPEAFQRRIFERFTQVDGSFTRRHGGSGLGAAIARELVELMGGTIGLDSAVGKGSTFWFTVPLETQVEEPGDPFGSVFRKEGRALIVAADVEGSALLKDWLESWSLKVVMVRNGAEARSRMVVSAANKHPFHLAIIAEDRLDTNPISFASFVKNDPLITNLRLILLRSASASGGQAVPPGYDTVVPWPAAKTVIFNAIHFAHPLEETATSVVRLPTLRTAPQIARSGQRILLAEDNAVNQKVIGKILEQAGHTVRIAADGEEALEALENQALDVALIDLHMPGLSGIDVAKGYAFMATGEERIPLVALTADALEDTRAKCMAAGFDAFLTKPVRAARLLEAVDDVVRKKTRPLPALATTEAVASRRPNSPRSVLDEDILKDLENLDDGTHFVKDLIEVFLVDAEQILREMEQAVSAGDLVVLRDLAHALQGCASTVGAAELRETASRAKLVTQGEVRMRGKTYLNDVRASLEATREYLTHRHPPRRTLLHGK
ncbi:MAG: ATP-binding protein [Deferrisomatales bacterium]|nr:ATP-binding protein [Deferrisomatales bacterium]